MTPTTKSAGKGTIHGTPPAYSKQPSLVVATQKFAAETKAFRMFAAVGLNLEEVSGTISRMEQAQLSSTDDRPTLASHAKTLSKKIGGKMYAKSCGGAGVCKNLLCSHPYVDRKPATTSSSTATPEATIDPKIIAMIMKKCADDGFPVTETYTESILHECKGKIAATIKMVKENLTSRENTLHGTGRINIFAERASADSYASDRRITTSEECFKNGLPKSRDGFISSLERENKNIADIAAHGFTSRFARRMLKKYKTVDERQRITNVYEAEAKFREARGKIYTELKDKRVSDEELEEAMAQWDRDHLAEVQIEGNHFRQVLTVPAQEATSSLVEAEKGSLVEVEEDSDDESESMSDEGEFGEAPDYVNIRPKNDKEYQEIRARIAKELVEVMELQKQALALVEENGLLKNENTRLRVGRYRDLLSEVDEHMKRN